MQTKAQRDFDEVFDEAEHIYSEPIYDTPSKVKSLTSEAPPSATPFFKRAYKISYPPRL